MVLVEQIEELGPPKDSHGNPCLWRETHFWTIMKSQNVRTARDSTGHLVQTSSFKSKHRGE